MSHRDNPYGPILASQEVIGWLEGLGLKKTEVRATPFVTSEVVIEPMALPAGIDEWINFSYGAKK